MERVDVGFGEAATRDRNEASSFQFLKAGIGVSTANAKILSKACLAWEAEIFLVRVLQQHHVDEFGTGRDLAVIEQEIWNNGVSHAGDDVCPVKNDVSIGVRECRADGLECHK